MKRLLTTSCMLLCAASLSAQNIDIKGKVLDTNQQVLEGASIAVYKQDSVLVNGTI